MAYRLPLVIKGVGFDVIPSAAALPAAAAAAATTTAAATSPHCGRSNQASRPHLLS